MKNFRLFILFFGLLFLGVCASVSGAVAKGGDAGLGSVLFVLGLGIVVVVVIYSWKKDKDPS